MSRQILYIEYELVVFKSDQVRQGEPSNRILFKSGFYPSTFFYSRFFQRFSFFTVCLVQWFRAHTKGKFFRNLGLQIAGKCVFLGILEFPGEF